MSNLIRIDKNTVYNYLNFDTHGSEAGDIIRSLLLYFSKSHQYDIFGFGKLDPVLFSKEMKISRSRLVGKCSSPFQFNGLNDEQIDSLYELEKEDPEQFRVYDSNLENALYILLKSNIIYPDNYLSKRSIKSKISSLKSVQVLTELKTHFKSLQGGSKINYSYALSREFRDNLSTYFLHINIVDVISLRKPNIDGLYMYLSNELQMMKAEFIEMKEQDFDLLCSKAYINSKRERDKKSRLIKVFERIKVDTSLTSNFWDYTFIKKNENSKWEYKVVLINKNQYKDKAEKNNFYNQRFMKILEQNVYRECLETFKSLYAIEDDIIAPEFKLWLQLSDKKDKEEKILAYKNAYFRVKGNIPSYINQEINSWFKELRDKQFSIDFK